MTTDSNESLGFNDLNLDDRIQHAIALLGWEKPTLVQQKAIPYFLQGKDVLARARTGSGKTAAYLVPLIQKIIEAKVNYYSSEQVTRALILAPTKELCKQITEHIDQLTIECKRDVRSIDLSPAVPALAQKSLIDDNPDIIVGTPLKILMHLEGKNLTLKKSLEYLILDEADIMIAFDHKKDIEEILGFLPRIYQAFLTSATLGDETKQLKKLVLHNPVVLKLEEPPLPPTEQLTQYVIRAEEIDKVVLLYALFRLNMIRGKTIIFVNTVDKGYKLRMYLSQFGINTCILNSEMPVASRCHIVDEFNKGKYNTIIASDETTVHDPSVVKNKRKRDKESGVSRGIDFHLVANIINFDLPSSVDAYIHRVGRSARGSSQGTALSMVAHRENTTFNKIKTELSKLMPNSSVFQDFIFNLDRLDGFKYRANDAWSKCTRIAVKDMRKKELKTELLNSSKLKSYFEDNPKDLQVLHGINGKTLSSAAHMKNVPDYNIPTNLRGVASSGIKKTKVDKKGQLEIRKKKIREQKQRDPLRSMKFSGFKKQED